MLWNSERSLPLPAYSLVATLNCVTCLPDARARISGSRVRRPVRRTLFTVRISLFGRPTGHGPTLRAAGGAGCRPRRSGPGGAAGRAGGGAFGEQLDPSRRRSPGGHRPLIPGSPATRAARLTRPPAGEATAARPPR